MHSLYYLQLFFWLTIDLISLSLYEGSTEENENATVNPVLRYLTYFEEQTHLRNTTTNGKTSTPHI